MGIDMVKFSGRVKNEDARRRSAAEGKKQRESRRNTLTESTAYMSAYDNNKVKI